MDGDRGAAQNVLAEGVEELVRADDLPELHRQPVHEEPVGAGAPLAPLPYLFEPVVVGLECRLPMRRRGADLRRSAFSFRLQEHRVLDEVERAEARTARIQRLEDDLSVVALVEVDGDDVEEAVEAGLERLDAFGLSDGISLAVVGDPLVDPVVEISPRAGNASARSPTPPSRRREERLAVAPRRPDLEPEIAVRRATAVEDQLGKLSGDVGGAVLLATAAAAERMIWSVVRRCWPSMTRRGIDAAGLEVLLVEDDRPEEVALPDVRRRIGDVPLGGIGDVVPEDTPSSPPRSRRRPAGTRER